MQTIFDSSNCEELIQRIQSLHSNCEAQWGKMNVFQMARHNTIWNEWILGTNSPSYRQEFMGKIFGRIALKRTLNEKPLDKNIPTSKPFKVEETEGDLAGEKTKWISLLRTYETYSNPNFIHDFFGRMTEEQMGILVYKHTDHHLRQFNC